MDLGTCIDLGTCTDLSMDHGSADDQISVCGCVCDCLWVWVFVVGVCCVCCVLCVCVLCVCSVLCVCVDELKLHSNICVHECARCAIDLPSWPTNYTAQLGSTTGQHYWPAL